MDTSYTELQKAYETLILSASGWRKVFALSGDEQDHTELVSEADRDLVFLAALAFAAFLPQYAPRITTIVVGTDSRPTGSVLQTEILTALCTTAYAEQVQSVGITAAPEIMCYAKSLHAAFIYISASHNPIGHNGLKFGIDTGGVLDGSQSAALIALFTQKCIETPSHEAISTQRITEHVSLLTSIMSAQKAKKQAALTAYHTFLKEVISNAQEPREQAQFFSALHTSCTAMAHEGSPFTLIADFNGSARAASIDRLFFEEHGMQLVGIAEETGTIMHGIIPEGENLETCIAAMESLHAADALQAKNALFGYMPDCDGDRGNIIYWDDQVKKALPVNAQEVFALSVIAELSTLSYSMKVDRPLAIAVNGPTSLRINEIAHAFNAHVYYAEVGEANVVNRANDLRRQGYLVRIVGEGSNGGNITYPAAVRDPLNTLFAILKLLLIHDTDSKKCPFHLWCEKSQQKAAYRPHFTLSDIIHSLPQYRTTPTQEQRALLHIHTKDHAALKRAYQQVFLHEWESKKELLKQKYGIFCYQVFSYNETSCTENLKDYGVSGKGGLKIQFYNATHTAIAFIWMRGSGTEPVFRTMADIKGKNSDAERYLVQWQNDMVRAADAAASSQN
ncbi:MAG: phosphoglucomutase [Treponema sp.]